jgi:hypothetical protein
MKFTQININTLEGKFLLAAVAVLCGKSKTPEAVMAELKPNAEAVEDSPESVFFKKPVTLESELAGLINRRSLENASDTPDYILAQYLIGCLDNYNATIRARRRWYGNGPAEKAAGSPVEHQEQMGGQSEYATGRATLMVNFGPAGRHIPGLVNPNQRLDQAIVSVIDYYDAIIRKHKLGPYEKAVVLEMPEQITGETMAAGAVPLAHLAAGVEMVEFTNGRLLLDKVNLVPATFDTPVLCYETDDLESATFLMLQGKDFKASRMYFILAADGVEFLDGKLPAIKDYLDTGANVFNDPDGDKENLTDDGAAATGKEGQDNG